jgi:hypothetical protein
MKIIFDFVVNNIPGFAGFILGCLFGWLASRRAASKVQIRLSAIEQELRDAHWEMLEITAYTAKTCSQAQGNNVISS